jgi:diadenosine tetraphosphatase ApaH/serine/threonine PP2A family protein phosphatase
LAWSHKQSVYVLGGFEFDDSVNCVDGYLQLDLTLLFPHYSRKKSSAREIEKKMDGNGGPKFRLSPTVCIAATISQGAPAELSKMTMMIPLSRLQDEHHRLIPSNPVYFSNPEEYKQKELSAKYVQPILSHLFKLKDWSMENIETTFFMNPKGIIKLIKECKAVIKSQSIVCRVKVPVKIFGDIHGQYNDLMRFFEVWRGPIEASFEGDIDSFDYVFLGNYVDYGTHNLETICLLLTLKVKYPMQIHLLRGSHEVKFMNNEFGFSEECAERLHEDITDPESVFEAMNDLFNWLPLAAVIDDKIMCIHGGLGNSVKNIKDIESLTRPLVVTSDNQLLIDILWSEPNENDKELGVRTRLLKEANQVLNIYTFGPENVEKFLVANKLELIIRGHSCVLNGFERFAKGQLITVFSATNYRGTYKNAGGSIFVHKNCEISPRLIFPLDATATENWGKSEKQSVKSQNRKASECMNSSYV